MSDTGNILEIRDLNKTYVDHENDDDFALKNLTFDIPKGSIMGLIGENGAGKTTTIKLILNLIKRDSGNIKVFGLDNIENEMAIKKRIGVVLDEGGFYEELSPVNISRIMKNIHIGWDESLFQSYLAKFKIIGNKKLKDFSKGMKMKLSLALAFSHKPDFLILDEPTSGLDPVIRSEVLDLFLDFIQDEEKSILFSTHITGDLDKIADYITFIHNGEMVFSKDADELHGGYGIIKCGINDFQRIDSANIAGYRKNKFGYEVLISNKEEAEIKYKDMVLDSANLEDIMLFHVKNEGERQ